MRKCNAVLSVAILFLFLLHGIAGGFQLMGILPGGSQVLEIFAWILICLVGVHTILGSILTVDTLRICRKNGRPYFRQNIPFWIRRISGFAIMILIVTHLLIFAAGGNGELYRLHLFENPELITQILLILTIAIHLVMNIRPLMIALGIPAQRSYARDIMLILSLILLFCAAAMLVYYLRWNVFWR